MARPSQTGRKRTRFEVQADAGSEVFVAGTFNGWNPTKSKLTWQDGHYATNVLLAKGTHEYKFVINGTWCADPGCSDWMPNGVGSLNSVVTVQ
jgi:1,4-alpha-glucan branching enzyme